MIRKSYKGRLVEPGNEGGHWIKINRTKTGNPEDVPFLPIPEAIIEKYRGIMLISYDESNRIEIATN
ncbi:MAG: hypothetical protein JST42_02080 [Bacteroidetes bacterium]|nr:hypothetical protein [Bacteroidota bacterium]